MPPSLPSTVPPAYLPTLRAAASAFRASGTPRPAAETVGSALLEAEKAAKQHRLIYPFSDLLGCWQLCFATGTRKLRQRGGIALGKGFYMPRITPAQIAFSAASEGLLAADGKGTICNQIQLGSLRLTLTGPVHYPGKKNLLAFDFTHLQLCLFGRTLYKGNLRGGAAQAERFYEQSIAKLPFFAFFLVTEDMIAARGRGGGLALWIRI